LLGGPATFAHDNATLNINVYNNNNNNPGCQNLAVGTTHSWTRPITFQPMTNKIPINNYTHFCITALVAPRHLTVGYAAAAEISRWKSQSPDISKNAHKVSRHCKSKKTNCSICQSQPSFVNAITYAKWRRTFLDNLSFDWRWRWKIAGFSSTHLDVQRTLPVVKQLFRFQLKLFIVPDVCRSIFGLASVTNIPTATHSLSHLVFSGWSGPVVVYQTYVRELASSMLIQSTAGTLAYSMLGSTQPP